MLSIWPTLPKQALVFTCLLYKSLEKKKMWEKEKLLVTFYHLHQILNCHLQSLSVWKSEICCLGKG